ncbi:MAG: hypothetical protein ACRD0L_02545 [Acidimicrobiales bacterium]
MYRVSGAPVTWEQRVLAACLLGGAAAVASHTSAGVLWGLPGIRRGRPEITVPMGLGALAAGDLSRLHHARRLPGVDRQVQDGVPVTSPARTLMDLAGRVPPATLAEAVDDAMCRGLVDMAHLDRRISALAGGRRGVAQLREATQAWAPGPMPGSQAEIKVIRCLLAAGIPAPVRQHEVRDGGRLVARLDMAWPDAKVGLETDSWRWHGGRERFHQDQLRILQLRAVGWDVVAVAPRNVEADGGAGLCRAVGAALARSARLAPAS